MADNPVSQDQQNSASVPVPSDNQIPYTVDAMGKPAFPDPSPLPPGHVQTYNAAQARADAAARYQASQAAARAKSDAQARRDAGTTNVKFTPAPKRGK